MLQFHRVQKKYGAKFAVHSLDYTLKEGRLVALLGPNGSGKTTLMKMVAGLVCPTAGEILLDGEKVGPKTKRHIAYMPTEGYFYSYMTIRDAGRYYRDFFRDFDEGKYLSLLAEERLDTKLKISALSSGMTAKVKLALTFARNSRLIMLDEPLNGIDLIARERTLQLIDQNRAQNRTLIVSSHLVDELEEMIDDALFMKDGELVLAGSREEIRQAHGMGIVDMYRRIYGEGGVTAGA